MKGVVFKWRGEKDGYLAALLLSRERKHVIPKVTPEPLIKRDWVRVSPNVVKIPVDWNKHILVPIRNFELI